MNLNLEAADILLAARDDISREGGWQQKDFGAMYERAGAVCAVGAICRQTYVYGHDIDAGILAQAALSGLVGFIGPWNDDPERTVEEVMAAMDAAAADLKGRG